MSTKSCKSKIMHLTDFISALPQNATAAQWFRTHGTRDVPKSIRRWVATMSTPHYTVRQIPRNSPRGSVIKRVVAVRQPNNTMNIGVPRTPRVRTPSPRYTVRQSPTQGAVRRAVTVVRQPNNTMSIGVPRTPRVRTPSPRYTVRQSPTQGAVRRAVTVVRQPNNTMSIGVPRTPPVRHVTQMHALRRRIRDMLQTRSVYGRRPGARPPRRM